MGASGAAPVTVDLTAANDMGWPLHQAAASGEAAVVSDLQSLFGDIPARHWPDPPHSAAVLPLMQPGGQAAAGLLVLGISPRRAFDDAYRRFFELASQKIASMIANADAFEQERRRAETPAELDRAKTNCFSKDLIPDSVFELVHRAFQADGTLGGTHSRAVPLLDAAGGTVERIGTASDITRRKQAEGIMFFQAHMLASLQEAICAVDENFMITFWNGMAEKIFGWTAREAVGSPSKEIFKMVSPSNREESIANILKNNGYTGEAVYRNKYGKEVHTSVICSVMRDAKGIYKGNVSPSGTSPNACRWRRHCMRKPGSWMKQTVKKKIFWRAYPIAFMSLTRTFVSPM
jgi:PAS domain S-box-containing protein